MMNPIDTFVAIVHEVEKSPPIAAAVVHEVCFGAPAPPEAYGGEYSIDNMSVHEKVKAAKAKALAAFKEKFEITDFEP